MRRLTLAAIAAVMIAVSALPLLGTAVLTGIGTCAPINVTDDVPNSLSTVGSDGHPVTLDRTQLRRAHTILTTAELPLLEPSESQADAASGWAVTSGSACPAAPLPPPPASIDETASGHVADPTGTGGFVTHRTAHLITQTRSAFPTSAWWCWAPRPGTASEHPLGRACDVTFGNTIGEVPDAEHVAEGWRMTLWLQQHAETLAVQYLIWQGHIWSSARAEEGWRAYNGGGMHNPDGVTGGHYDHLHITVRL